MKSSSESHVSLDIPAVGVSLKHNFILYVTHQEDSIGLVGLVQPRIPLSGVVPQRDFLRTNQYVPPLLRAASHTDARVVKLVSPAKTDGAPVLENYGEVTPGSGSFLAANETAEVFLQSFIVVPLSFRFILAPKVSRYLYKSVLIL